MVKFYSSADKKNAGPAAADPPKRRMSDAVRRVRVAEGTDAYAEACRDARAARVALQTRRHKIQNRVINLEVEQSSVEILTAAKGGAKEQAKVTSGNCKRDCIGEC